MRRRMYRLATLLGLGVGPMLGCSQAGPTDAVGSIKQAATMPAVPLSQVDVHTTLTYPKESQLLGLALAANGTLDIRSGAQVLSTGGFGAVSNMGSGTTTIATDGVTGSVQSVPALTLGDRAQVHGDVVAPSIGPGNGSSITGSTSNELSKIQPPQTIPLDVTYPEATAAPSAWLEPNETSALAPGRYNAIRAANGSTIKLRAGTYFAETFEFDSGSRVEIDTTAGTVVVFVRTRLRWQGTAKTPSGGIPDWLVIYTGNELVSMQSSFYGALLAPSASISFQGLPAVHKGMFLGRDLNVEGNQRVVLTPMNTTLMALDPVSCSLQMPPRKDLTGDKREFAFQLDIARYCTARNTNVCLTRVEALAKSHRVDAAAQMALGTVEPNVYLGVARDRTRKVERAQQDSAYAEAICSGKDTDGDLVPDTDDVCPGTPSLTPTDDHGCPTALPEAPTGTQVRAVLDRARVVINNTCSTGTIPTLVTPGAFFWPSDPSKGVFWVTSKARNQDSGCAIWYEMEIKGETRDGRPAHLNVIFPQVTGQFNDLVGMTGRPVPAEFVQFQAMPTDTGPRGQLATDLKPYRGEFRARAINSAGVRSPWTDWRSQTPRDCRSLGFTCGD